MSTWPWAPAPSSATLISCSPAAGAFAGGDGFLRPRLLILTLPLPGVAEETERGTVDSPFSTSRRPRTLGSCGAGCAFVCSLVVGAGHVVDFATLLAIVRRLQAEGSEAIATP